MIAVLQRVSGASCRVGGKITGEIGKGLVILLGVAEKDTEEDARRLAAKIVRCRIFPDVEGKCNLSVCDVGGAALVISNFTLLADYAHGNRPSYFGAAAPREAEELYMCFISALRAEKLPVATGRFGAHMEIGLAADGPVTLVMDSQKIMPKRSNADETAH